MLGQGNGCPLPPAPAQIARQQGAAQGEVDEQPLWPELQHDEGGQQRPYHGPQAVGEQQPLIGPQHLIRAQLVAGVAETQGVDGERHAPQQEHQGTRDRLAPRLGQQHHQQGEQSQRPAQQQDHQPPVITI
ncbi:hypothetical protein D3C85_702950 [compost metagenome]